MSTQKLIGHVYIQELPVVPAIQPEYVYIQELPVVPAIQSECVRFTSVAGMNITEDFTLFL